MSSTSPAAGKTARIWQTWMRLAEKAASIFGVVLFTILYFVCFAPVAVLTKVLGKSLLPHFKPDSPSFYFPRKPSQPTAENLKKQW